MQNIILSNPIYQSYHDLLNLQVFSTVNKYTKTKCTFWVVWLNIEEECGYFWALLTREFEILIIDYLGCIQTLVKTVYLTTQTVRSLVYWWPSRQGSLWIRLSLHWFQDQGGCSHEEGHTRYGEWRFPKHIYKIDFASSRNIT